MTASFWVFALSLVVFVASHAVPTSGGMRRVLIARLGLWGYLIVYSALSLAALIWLIYAYIDAPYIEIWVAPAWWPPVAAYTMPVAFLLLSLGLPRRAPKSTGVFAITRQPAMWGLGLWAVLHMIGNGDAAALLLFGSMALLAGVGAINMDARMRKSLGNGWDAYARQTSLLPFTALISGRNRLRFDDVNPVAVAMGCVVYTVVLWLHGPVIGISVLELL